MPTTTTLVKEKTTSPNWGGKRKDSGRVRLNYKLSKDTAVLLKTLLQYLQLTEPDVEYTPDGVLDILIVQAVHRVMKEKDKPIEK